MDLGKRIAELRQEIKVLEQEKEEEQEKARKQFKLRGTLTVKETSYGSYNFPKDFRKMHIELNYSNMQEAIDLDIYAKDGGRVYYYIEGYIIASGGGLMILEAPCKATESEWLSIVNNKIPRKFLRPWIKELINE